MGKMQIKMLQPLEWQSMEFKHFSCVKEEEVRPQYTPVWVSYTEWRSREHHISGCVDALRRWRVTQNTNVDLVYNPLVEMASEAEQKTLKQPLRFQSSLLLGIDVR